MIDDICGPRFEGMDSRMYYIFFHSTWAPIPISTVQIQETSCPILVGPDFHGLDTRSQNPEISLPFLFHADSLLLLSPATLAYTLSLPLPSLKTLKIPPFLQNPNPKAPKAQNPNHLSWLTLLSFLPKMIPFIHSIMISFSSTWRGLKSHSFYSFLSKVL